MSKTVSNEKIQKIVLIYISCLAYVLLKCAASKVGTTDFIMQWNTAKPPNSGHPK